MQKLTKFLIAAILEHEDPRMFEVSADDRHDGDHLAQSRDARSQHADAAHVQPDQLRQSYNTEATAVGPEAAIQIGTGLSGRS